MKIKQDLGTFRHIKEIEYNPTPAELNYWYSGTHAGIDPNNPYAKRGMRVERIKFEEQR